MKKIWPMILAAMLLATPVVMSSGCKSKRRHSKRIAKHGKKQCLKRCKTTAKKEHKRCKEQFKGDEKRSCKTKADTEKKRCKSNCRRR
ncbi:MAG: hypothetical protein JRH20_08825 [Deltaproteobacteria bacterium]|nr:hypothetical protein [Deltaproteobacteria bacterium]